VSSIKDKLNKPKTAAPPVQDEFVSGVNRALGALKPYAGRLAVAAGAMLVVLIAVSVYRWWGARNDRTATALLARALEVYEQPVMSPEEAKILQSLDEADRPITHPTAKARAEAALVHLDKLKRQYGGRAVAEGARLFHAGVLFDAEKFDEAAATYRAVAASDAPEATRVRAREGLAYALEAKAIAQTDAATRQAGLEAALAAFAELQPREDGPDRDRALYHQARVLQSLGRNDEAVALYKQTLDAAPETPLRDTITERLAALDQPTPK
jgi:tetratricopeptide (TPR) repeat protein